MNRFSRDRCSKPGKLTAVQWHILSGKKTSVQSSTAPITIALFQLIMPRDATDWPNKTTGHQFLWLGLTLLKDAERQTDKYHSRKEFHVWFWNVLIIYCIGCGCYLLLCTRKVRWRAYFQYIIMVDWYIVIDIWYSTTWPLLWKAETFAQ